MAFAVICKSCQARFLLNDDLLRRKVAGRVVTVRCRQCHAPIEVDASELAPPKVASGAKPEAVPTPTPVKATLAHKPAPAPPRPAKSATLMGIGAPPRPAGAPEMVALSPGLLEVRAPAAARGFPEPPPPPTPVTIEDLSDDWDVSEPATPRRIPIPDAPESVDDFIEELPPSLPPPAAEDDELPTSIGTPALSALVHHEALVPKPKADDFFANVGAPSPLEVGAPTIDVSTLGSVASAPTGPSIDLSSLDAPRTGKQTLPLFGLSELDLGGAPPLPASALPKPLAEPPVPSERPESARTRRNVVAPPTSSVPPPAPASRRSALAVPVLVVLAAAAGVLIWKRSGAPPERVEMVEAPRATATAPPPPEATPEPTPVSAATTSVAPEDDVTFETKPARGAAKSEKTTVATRDAAPPAQALPAPAASAPKSEPAVEPALPAPKAEPKPTEPTEPSEPAGPFDREAAAAALTTAASAASACRKEGDPSGTASVVITFAPSGRVTSASIGGPPFAGTPTGGCIAAALRKARVPAFEGDRVTVSKTIVVQ